MDAPLTAALEQTTLTPDHVAGILRAAAARLREGQDTEHVELRKQLEREEHDVSRKIANLVRLVEDGDGYEEARERLKELRAQREALQSRRAGLPTQDTVVRLERMDPIAFHKAFLGEWRAKDVFTRRKALHRVIRRIVVHPEGHLDLDLGPEGRDDQEPPQAPFGPPEGSAPINRGWVLCGEVSRPKVYVTAAL